MDDSVQDICRVCRSEATPDKPLFHPCICTGSIKFIHQECLVQWLRYSEKEFCELCNHRFSFIPIYSPDMPKRLPIKDIICGLLTNLFTAIKYWFHYSIVAIAWLGIVPLTAYRIYRGLFAGSWSAILSLPSNLLSTENLAADGFYGCCLVTCTLCAFISVVWLREQLVRGGGPGWLEAAQDPPQAQVEVRGEAIEPPLEAANEPGIGVNNNVNNNNLGEDEITDEEDEDDESNELLIANHEDAPAVLGDNPEVEGGVVDDIQARVDLDAPAVAPDEANWNPGEWDRAAEELTWERVLGLDGSLVFFEHVFWVISMNTVFVFIFAYFPYHVGAFTVRSLGILDSVDVSNFEGVVSTLLGYIIIGVALVFLHSIAKMVKFKRTQKLLGQCYVGLKVALLFVFELGVFPLIFGIWFDVCSLPILGATLSDRKASFRSAPGTSMFIHWLVGMIYVFYFASFMYILKEVLRQGVLWFPQDLNDPDFNPIQDMIHSSIFKHIRKILASLILFGTAVLLMVWFPVCIIKKLLPGFLPYNVIQTSTDAPVNEISFEFLILQLMLPALMDHNHLRQTLKTLIRVWCIVISYILDLRSYLLGDVPLEENSEDVPAQIDDNNQAYRVPKFFAIRVVLLLVFTAFSLLLSGLFLLTVPVYIGRKLFALWLGSAKVHELNTIACGLYVGLLLARCAAILCNWIPRGWNAIASRIHEGCVIAVKGTIAGCVLIGIIPLLIGLIFDVVVIVPVRVPLNQSPIYYLWQDWAFGVLHTKVICGLSMMFDWRLREILEAIYHAGLKNINLKYIIIKLAFPVVLVFGITLSTPYVMINGILPIFGVAFETRNLLIRRIYPFLLIASALMYLIHWQINKFCRLYEHIKNDKYLVGKRLVNYDSDRARKNNSNLQGSLSSSSSQTPVVAD
ncbi:E3 ubiquitin-protein ligase MARCHF6 isoform X2 [Brevipalpus obovatus]|uniref:E3 ubiquitin-protein ligase MARCHF6 isoform X2 n=1 Tax=Brevipalpus obovatus TaxID=246614 RepID=UPI003D9DC247